MKYIISIVLFFNLLACSLPAKQKKQVEDKAIPTVEAKQENLENWADEYYSKTYFIVENPIVMESYNDLIKACKSNDQFLMHDYQDNNTYKIQYKEMPINIKTASGFNKVIYVTKGACRELSLYKSPKLQEPKQIRKSIKSMELVYIYNHGTYLKQLIFNTPFKGVQFLVE